MFFKLKFFAAAVAAMSIIGIIGCMTKSSDTPDTPMFSYAHTTVAATKGVVIVSDTVILTGTGTVDSFTISPNLNTQTGLAFSKTTGKISGAPTTVRATTTYTVIAHGPGGADTATVSVTVADAPVTAAALEAHTWKLSGLTSNPAISLTGTGPKHVNIYDSGFTTPCDRHLTQKYLANGKVVSSHDSAATALGCGLPDSTTTWTLSGRIITTVDSDMFTERDSVVSISATQLVETTVMKADESPDNVAHTFTLTSIAKP